MRFLKTILPVLGVAASAMAQSAYDDPQTVAWREICDNNYYSGIGLVTPWDANYRMGIDMGNVTCADMAKDWEVYNRRLSPADVALAKSSATAPASSVYFSLYNRRSGVLRTFLWVPSAADQSGSYYSLKLTVQNDGGTKVLDHSLFAIEGAGKAHTVVERMDPNKNTEKWYFTDRHVPDRWVIEDTFLSFDMNGAHSTPLYFDYYLMSHTIGEIKLSGQVGNDNQSIVKLGVMETMSNVFKSVAAGFTKGTKAFEGGVDDMWTFGQNLQNLGATALGKSIMDISTTASNIPQGNHGTGVIWAASNLIEGFLGWGKGRQVGMAPQAISLNGTITVKTGLTNPRIPLANANFIDETQKAMFARTYNTTPDKNLGLFVMNVAPDVKVFEVLGGTYGQSGSSEAYYKPKYYISIADPTCGLYINPASGAKLVEVKVAPVIHFDYQQVPGLSSGSSIFANKATDVNPAFGAPSVWNKYYIIGDRRSYALTPMEKPTVKLKISFVFDIGRGQYFEAVNTYSPNSVAYSRISSLTGKDYNSCSAPDFIKTAIGQGSTPLAFKGNSVGPNWYSLYGVPAGNVNTAAVSGHVGDLEESTLQTTFTGSVISFSWKVSSEANYDFLEFDVDGVFKDRISGLTNWAARSFTLPYGTHTVRWQYYKDGSLRLGEDRGMINQVSYH